MIFSKQKPLPELETKHLLLRSPSVQDSAHYHEILLEPSVSQFSDLPRAPTPARSKQYMRWMHGLNQRGLGAAWLITLKKNNRIIGSVRINSIEQKAKCGRLAYELHPNEWNNGYATDAVCSVVEHAHNFMSLNRLEACVSTDNISSHKVLTKNGFTHEGTQRQKAWFHEQYWNVELFGRIATDKMWTPM